MVANALSLSPGTDFMVFPARELGKPSTYMRIKIKKIMYVGIARKGVCAVYRIDAHY
jgi:hypothetical protein